MVAITFGNGAYANMRDKYVEQLHSKKIFSKVFGYSNADIDSSFYDQHKNFINNNPKGYGYWIWKPYLIAKTLDTMSNGDVLLYGDAASNMKGSSQQCTELVTKVLKAAKGLKIIASKQGWNIRWIKSDLYFALGWQSLVYAFRPMAEAGRLIIQKDKRTVPFIKQWLHYATNDYHNIDDTPSKYPNLPFFVAHRADQSIFSLLFNKHGGTLANFDDTWRKSESHYKVYTRL